MHTYMHVYMYLSICLVTPPKKNTVFTFLLVFKVFFVFSPIFFWHLFSCHFWLPLKYLEFAINCTKLQNVSDWRLEIEDSQKNFFNPGLDWRLKILRKTWRLKILRKTSSIQVYIEEVFLRIFNLQSSIQTWIEEVFLRIFNLQSDTFCN